MGKLEQLELSSVFKGIFNTESDAEQWVRIEVPLL